jgi:hypothetical protein
VLEKSPFIPERKLVAARLQSQTRHLPCRYVFPFDPQSEISGFDLCQYVKRRIDEYSRGLRLLAAHEMRFEPPLAEGKGEVELSARKERKNVTLLEGDCNDPRRQFGVKVRVFFTPSALRRCHG